MILADLEDVEVRDHLRYIFDQFKALYETSGSFRSLVMARWLECIVKNGTDCQFDLYQELRDRPDFNEADFRGAMDFISSYVSIAIPRVRSINESFRKLFEILPA